MFEYTFVITVVSLFLPWRFCFLDSVKAFTLSSLAMAERNYVDRNRRKYFFCVVRNDNFKSEITAKFYYHQNY